MSTAPQYRPHYSVDDYRLWEGEWELWNGIPVAMTPSASGLRGRVHGRIVTALNNAIDAADCEASVLVEVDWVLSRDTVVRPDVSVVCGDPPQRHLESAPAMIVEVLSPSTHDRDMNFKRQLYLDQAVGWYITVDPNSEAIRVLHLTTAGDYERSEFDTGLDVTICGACSLRIEFDRILR